jgi:hypothetical protein
MGSESYPVDDFDGGSAEISSHTAAFVISLANWSICREGLTNTTKTLNKLI